MTCEPPILTTCGEPLLLPLPTCGELGLLEPDPCWVGPGPPKFRALRIWAPTSFEELPPKKLPSEPVPVGTPPGPLLLGLGTPGGLLLGLGTIARGT